MAEVDAGEAATVNSKEKRKAPENLQAIQADVASFAASLGLAAAAAGEISSGFDDSDFRKKGPIGKKGSKNAVSAGEDGAEGGSKKDKKKKKTKTIEDPSGKRTSKTGSKKSDSVEDVSDEEDEVRPGKGKRERGNGVKSDAPSKGAKQSSQIEPPKSKIHEVLDSALAGADLPNTKKRKGVWNDARGNEEHGAQLPKRSSFQSGGADQADSTQRLRDEAQQLMERAAQEYERSRYKDSDAHWLMTARRSGTSADKVAAMTVILQDNPKANIRTLDALIGMLTSKAGKRHAATGIDALKELFIFNLLPDRKLKYFSQQPVSTLPETKERASKLLEWYWEDCLKHRYENFVLALEEATKDTLFFLKEKALKTVYELLKSKPEQERRLLSALVNKLGDPERKMASNASYLLSGLLTAHPNMKRFSYIADLLECNGPLKVVVDDVEAFVFRPHVGLRARYYAVVFLNQIVLSNRDDGPKLAKQLIDLYFSLFKAVTSVVDEEDHDKTKKGEKGKKKGFGKGKYKGSSKAKEKEKSADFTMEIDSRLLSALLTGVNRALPYIKADDLDSVTQENTVLFRLVHSTNFNVAVQALMLLHQLLTKSQAISDRFYRALYAVLLSKGLVKSSKAEMFLGLIFKALKSDVDSRRMSAFAKRLTQVAMHQPPQFACGSLLLLSEILKARPSLWNCIVQPEDHDEEEEHFEDVRDDTDSRVVDTNNDQGPIESGGTEDVWPKKGSYDAKARDPLYCNAHRACWWELTILASHMHPSVVAMARTLLSGANIVYNGDPLRDLALGVFLDRFTEKKPKALKFKQAGTWHGSSLSLPSKMGGAVRPIGEEFSTLAEDQVAPEDLVFHKFYVTKSTTGKRKLKKKKNADDEDDVTAGLLGDEAFEGDDSGDEEVDALLEQEADIEMDGGDESEEGDVESDEDDVVLNEQEDDMDGSEVDEFDNSEDDEADGLLEAGLAMSSSDDDEEADALLEAGSAMSSGDDEDIAGDDFSSLNSMKPSRIIKSSETKKRNVSKSTKTDHRNSGKLRTTSKVSTSKLSKTNKLSTSKTGKTTKVSTSKHVKRSSVFQEAESDGEE